MRRVSAEEIGISAGAVDALLELLGRFRNSVSSIRSESLHHIDSSTEDSTEDTGTQKSLTDVVATCEHLWIVRKLFAAFREWLLWLADASQSVQGWVNHEILTSEASCENLKCQKKFRHVFTRVVSKIRESVTNYLRYRESLRQKKEHTLTPSAREVDEFDDEDWRVLASDLASMLGDIVQVKKASVDSTVECDDGDDEHPDLNLQQPQAMSDSNQPKETSNPVDDEKKDGHDDELFVDSRETLHVEEKNDINEISTVSYSEYYFPNF